MVTITNARSAAGLSAQVTSAKPAVAWSELVGANPRTANLTGVLAAREVFAQLGESGGNISGSLAGTLVLTTTNVNGVKATTILTSATLPTAGNTVTIGNKTYAFVSTLNGANQVLIEATATLTLDNLVAAVNGAAGAGTKYGAGTVAHTQVDATKVSATVRFDYKIVGSIGNSVNVSTNVSGATWSSGSTLAGGISPSMADGLTGNDQTGDTLPALTAIDGLEVVCRQGAITVTLAGGKVTALPIPAGGVLHIAGQSMASLGNITITATAIDTLVALTALYH